MNNKKKDDLVSTWNKKKRRLWVVPHLWPGALCFHSRFYLNFQFPNLKKIGMWDGVVRESHVVRLLTWLSEEGVNQFWKKTEKMVSRWMNNQWIIASLPRAPFPRKRCSANGKKREISALMFFWSRVSHSPCPLCVPSRTSKKPKNQN